MIWWLLLYSAILHSRALTALTCDSTWVNSFLLRVFEYPPKWCTYSADMKLLPSGRVLCTPYKHAPCHFMQSHIRKVYACLAVNCHLHFWQNDRDLLRATAIFLNKFWGGFFYRFLSNDMARDATTICFHFNNSAWRHTDTARMIPQTKMGNVSLLLILLLPLLLLLFDWLLLESRKERKNWNKNDF